MADLTFQPVADGEEDRITDLSDEPRLALLAACVVSQQRAGFGDRIDLREAPCPKCEAPGFNTGMGFWEHTCGAEILADGEWAEPCGAEQPAEQEGATSFVQEFAKMQRPAAIAAGALRAELCRLIVQMTASQRERFSRIYPDVVPDDKLEIAVDMCQRTVAKNRANPSRMAEPMTAEVARVGFLDMQVCAPAGWTDDQIVAFAERENPCGTAGGWQIRRDGDPRLGGAPERNPCQGGRTGNVHVTLDA